MKNNILIFLLLVNAVFMISVYMQNLAEASEIFRLENAHVHNNDCPVCPITVKEYLSLSKKLHDCRVRNGEIL